VQRFATQVLQVRLPVHPVPPLVTQFPVLLHATLVHLAARAVVGSTVRMSVVAVAAVPNTALL
jgi:hypothetical protein